MSVTLTPFRDATIWEGEDLVASGSGPHLFIGTSAVGQSRRALIRFDLIDIPSGSTVTQVDLSLTINKMSVSGTSPFRMAAHRLLASWGEGPSDAGESGKGTHATGNDATWTRRLFNDRLLWSSPGGDFVASPSATSTNNAEQLLSTEALVDDVQGWLEEPDSNHGWIILGDEETGRTARRLWSREGNEPPTLTVHYIPAS